MSRFPAIVLLLALGACSLLSPEARVREKLEQAGMRPKMAECVAGRLVSGLSTDQLKKLAALQAADDPDDKGKSMKHILRKLQALDDPQIVAVASDAGIACLLK